KFSQSRNDFEWADGSYMDYRNFYPGFPQSASGDCLAMDTSTANALWMNINCTAKLPVSCVRRSVPQVSCNSTPYQDGGIITSPRYPYSSSTPCDFFLSVGEGMRVKVNVTLEANKCCDYLTLYDGYLGGNVVANLTGEVFNAVYTTKTNFMRVSWQPKGGVNVRGMAV
ncbi:hypothetical protein PENTCL1PPCAC_21168, partial [Pristionchus entomophagus]